MASVCSMSVCLYMINELEEGEEDRRERRTVLWRQGMSSRAFSLILKSSLSYMLLPIFSSQLPVFLFHTEDDDVAFLAPVCCVCVCVCASLFLPLAEARANMKSFWADSMSE